MLMMMLVLDHGLLGSTPSTLMNAGFAAHRGHQVGLSQFSQQSKIKLSFLINILLRKKIIKIILFQEQYALQCDAYVIVQQQPSMDLVYRKQKPF